MRTGQIARRTFLALPLAATAAEDKVKLIAHRGGVVDEEHGENSPEALQAAIERGYWMVETDVRESRDGRLVVQHDEDFKRSYGVDRQVAEMSWEEISRLRAKPSGGRRLEFHELAGLCRGKMRLMIDTKEPSHPEAFYAEMERALRVNGLLESAFFIGTRESRERFKGKARISADRQGLREAMAKGEETGKLCFLFEHGRTLEAEGIGLAGRAGVPAVVSINTFHYLDTNHMKAARADIERMLKLGVTYFQIDSVYDRWLTGAADSD